MFNLPRTTGLDGNEVRGFLLKEVLFARPDRAFFLCLDEPEHLLCKTIKTFHSSDDIHIGNHAHVQCLALFISGIPVVLS